MYSTGEAGDARRRGQRGLEGRSGRGRWDVMRASQRTGNASRKLGFYPDDDGESPPGNSGVRADRLCDLGGCEA